MAQKSHQALTLNEEALQTMAETKRPVFVYEWLRWLDSHLPLADRSQVKECQKVLVGQLMSLVTTGSPGPPTRHLIGEKNLLCLCRYYSKDVSVKIK